MLDFVVNYVLGVAQAHLAIFLFLYHTPVGSGLDDVGCSFVSPSNQLKEGKKNAKYSFVRWDVLSGVVCIFPASFFFFFLCHSGLNELCVSFFICRCVCALPSAEALFYLLFLVVTPRRCAPCNFTHFFSLCVLSFEMNQYCERLWIVHLLLLFFCKTCTLCPWPSSGTFTRSPFTSPLIVSSSHIPTNESSLSRMADIVQGCRVPDFFFDTLTFFFSQIFWVSSLTPKFLFAILQVKDRGVSIRKPLYVGQSISSFLKINLFMATAK